jgi:hypothetical protein
MNQLTNFIAQVQKETSASSESILALLELILKNTDTKNNDLDKIHGSGYTIDTPHSNDNFLDDVIFTYLNSMRMNIKVKDKTYQISYNKELINVLVERNEKKNIYEVTSENGTSFNDSDIIAIMTTDNEYGVITLDMLRSLLKDIPNNFEANLKGYIKVTNTSPDDFHNVTKNDVRGYFGTLTNPSSNVSPPSSDPPSPTSNSPSPKPNPFGSTSSHRASPNPPSHPSKPNPFGSTSSHRTTPNPSPNNPFDSLYFMTFGKSKNLTDKEKHDGTELMKHQNTKDPIVGDYLLHHKYEGTIQKLIIDSYRWSGITDKWALGIYDDPVKITILENALNIDNKRAEELLLTGKASFFLCFENFFAKNTSSSTPTSSTPSSSSTPTSSSSGSTTKPFTYSESPFNTEKIQVLLDKYKTLASKTNITPEVGLDLLAQYPNVSDAETKYNSDPKKWILKYYTDNDYILNDGNSANLTTDWDTIDKDNKIDIVKNILNVNDESANTLIALGESFAETINTYFHNEARYPKNTQTENPEVSFLMDILNITKEESEGLLKNGFTIQDALEDYYKNKNIFPEWNSDYDTNIETLSNLLNVTDSFSRIVINTMRTNDTQTFKDAVNYAIDNQDDIYSLLGESTNQRVAYTSKNDKGSLSEKGSSTSLNSSTEWIDIMKNMGISEENAKTAIKRTSTLEGAINYYYENENTPVFSKSNVTSDITSNVVYNVRTTDSPTYKTQTDAPQNTIYYEHFYNPIVDIDDSDITIDGMTYDPSSKINYYMLRNNLFKLTQYVQVKFYGDGDDEKTRSLFHNFFKDADNKISDNWLIDEIRGDGWCLIRSILTHISVKKYIIFSNNGKDIAQPGNSTSKDLWNYSKNTVEELFGELSKGILEIITNDILLYEQLFNNDGSLSYNLNSSNIPVYNFSTESGKHETDIAIRVENNADGTKIINEKKQSIFLSIMPDNEPEKAITICNDNDKFNIYDPGVVENNVYKKYTVSHNNLGNWLIDHNIVNGTIDVSITACFARTFKLNILVLSTKNGNPGTLFYFCDGSIFTINTGFKKYKLNNIDLMVDKIHHYNTAIIFNNGGHFMRIESTDRSKIVEKVKSTLLGEIEW